MFTDIVGYSAMSEKNEGLALELLEVHRKLIRETLDTFNGHEIKTIGDAFMVEFASALDAVKCSIAIQKKLKEYNEVNEEDRKIFLRIGIHVGDVVEREGDIYGDGVNISSRLEPLALPGGICISEDVARQVQNKIDVPLEKMDALKLKNINLAVDIYQILIYADPKAAPPKIDNNKLAVLPFQNISPDRDTDYFSDGLTEEITMHLSRIKELKVVSRTTTMHYKNSLKDLQSIGKELNARYILEGSVRKNLDDLRITAQLIDVGTDTHLWAETYRGNMADIFDIQENVSKKIVEELRVTLSPEEKVALGKRATMDSKAFDSNLRAREFLYRGTKSYLHASTDLFNKALEIDPRYAAAYAGLAEAYALIYEWHEKKPEWLEKAMEASLKALMYDSSSSEAYSAMGQVYFHRKAIDEALTAINKAIELDGDNFFAFWLLGRIYRMMDREEEAVTQFKRVLELNPNFHCAYMDLRLTYTRLGNETELNNVITTAINFYPDYLLRNPDDARAITFYGSMLLRSGNKEKAIEQMERAISLSPNDAVMIYNAACFYANIGDKDKAIEYLGKAVSYGYEFYDYIKRDPDLDSIRNEPGYLEIMKQNK